MSRASQLDFHPVAYNTHTRVVYTSKGIYIYIRIARPCVYGVSSWSRSYTDDAVCHTSQHVLQKSLWRFVDQGDDSRGANKFWTVDNVTDIAADVGQSIYDAVIGLNCDSVIFPHSPHSLDSSSIGARWARSCIRSSWKKKPRRMAVVANDFWRWRTTRWSWWWACDKTGIVRALQCAGQQSTAFLPSSGQVGQLIWKENRVQPNVQRQFHLYTCGARLVRMTKLMPLLLCCSCPARFIRDGLIPVGLCWWRRLNYQTSRISRPRSYGFQVY